MLGLLDFRLEVCRIRFFSTFLLYYRLMLWLINICMFFESCVLRWKCWVLLLLFVNIFWLKLFFKFRFFLFTCFWINIQFVMWLVFLRLFLIFKWFIDNFLGQFAIFSASYSCLCYLCCFLFFFTLFINNFDQFIFSGRYFKVFRFLIDFIKKDVFAVFRDFIHFLHILIFYHFFERIFQRIFRFWVDEGFN